MININLLEVTVPGIGSIQTRPKVPKQHFSESIRDFWNIELFEDESCEPGRGDGFACMELRECAQMFRGEVWRSPSLPGVRAEPLKPVPVCPDRLHIKSENRPDPRVGRDWAGANKLAEKMAGSGNSI
jgi:hypothetical protein